MTVSFELPNYPVLGTGIFAGVGVKESLTGKLLRGRLKWVGPVDRMEGNGCLREWMRLEWRVEGEEKDRH